MSNREKALLLIFMMLLLGMGYYRFVLAGQLAQIKKLQNQIAQQEALIQEMKRKNYNDPMAMEKKIAELEQMIEQIYKIIPRYRDVPGLLVDLHQLLRRHNINAEEVTFGTLKPQQSYSVFNLSLKARGNPSDIVRFLKVMEKYKRPVRVEKLEFLPQPGGKMEVNLELAVYVLHEVQLDPLQYPFMEGQFGVNSYWEMFKYPSLESSVETSKGSEVKEESNTQ